MQMRGFLSDDDKAQVWRMFEAIAAADPQPVLSPQERGMLRRLWLAGEVKITCDYEFVKRIFERIKR